MSRTVSFRNQSPRLRLEMNDGTIIRVTVPSTDLVEAMKENFESLTAVLNGRGAEQKKALYSLAADLINCNLDAERVTVADLVHRFDWSVEDLVKFYVDYMAFIENIEKEKN